MTLEHLGGGGPFNNPYSRVVRAGDFLFISGQVGLEGGKVVEGGVAAETHRALQRTAEALALAGATLTDVVKVTIFLAERGDFPVFNEVYRTYFPNNPPARSTVIAQLVVNGRVEIDAIAYQPQGTAR